MYSRAAIALCMQLMPQQVAVLPAEMLSKLWVPMVASSFHDCNVAAYGRVTKVHEMRRSDQ